MERARRMGGMNSMAKPVNAPEPLRAPDPLSPPGQVVVRRPESVRLGPILTPMPLTPIVWRPGGWGPSSEDQAVKALPRRADERGDGASTGWTLTPGRPDHLAPPGGMPMDYIDTLRLSADEQAELLRYLDAKGDGLGAELRKHDRLGYRSGAGVILALKHPGGSVARYLVRPRNLGSGGLGFLHGSYLHQGSPCQLTLRASVGACQVIPGHVAWCRHVRGHIHEAGVAFDELIDPHAFVESCVRTDPQNHGVASTSTPMPALDGRALYVDSAVEEQELFSFQFGQLGAQAQTVGDAVEAMGRLEQEAFDLVVTELQLPGLSGLELLEQVVAMSTPPPVVALTADPDESVHSEALERGARDVLLKPYSFESLVKTLQPYLCGSGPEAGESAPLVSEHWSQPGMRPLIERYVARLTAQVEQLEMMLTQNPRDRLLRPLALEIKGSAGNYGYPTVSELAQQLCNCIDASAPVAELTRLQTELARQAKAAEAGTRRGRRKETA